MQNKGSTFAKLKMNKMTRKLKSQSASAKKKGKSNQKTIVQGLHQYAYIKEIIGKDPLLTANCLFCTISGLFLPME